jgi:hypothetical protein
MFCEQERSMNAVAHRTNHSWDSIARTGFVARETHGLVVEKE